MKAGRKRKPGPRKNGRLVVAIDKGTERTQAMQALYGPDGCDAIGRAYRAGLLGEGSEAKAMLDLARSIAGAYWIAYEQGRYQCALADRSFGNVTPIDQAAVKRREQWLAACLDDVNRMGRDVRRAFDQLVIDVHPDAGPAWLDEAVWYAKRRQPVPNAALIHLRKALDALEMLTG